MLVMYILNKDIKAFIKTYDFITKIILGLLFLLTFNLLMNVYFKNYKMLYFFLYELILNFNILAYWLFVIIIGVYFIELIGKKFAIRTIIKRKLFHFLALLIYIPGLIFLNENLFLSVSGIVLGLFLLIEKIRNNKYLLKKFPKLSLISKYLYANIDERDRSKLILTHTFLLFSCFHSLLMKNIYKADDMSLKFLSLIVLGIGDSMVYFYLYRLP
jgi:dolichol kinase